MTLAEAVQESRAKVNGASFFLAKMREVEAFSYHNLADAQEQFGYYLSAFLSFARSAPQILSKAVGWPPISAVRGSWSADEQTLERALKNARDLTIHTGQSGADSTVESFPESELPREPRHPLAGAVFISRLPGVPEVGIGVRAFTIRINGRDEPAVASCGKYLDLIRRIIRQFETSP